MKVGKAAACALGGGIILLEIANQKGYIKINWNKVNNKIDKATNTLEESITGQGPNWVDKVYLHLEINELMYLNIHAWV